MKYIKQFSIIITVSFLGEVLHALLPLPIPASIYGLLLMLAGLCCHIIPMDEVKETGKFLVEVMPLMFIPAAVGLTESWDRISPIFWQLIVGDCSIHSTCDGGIRTCDSVCHPA